MAQPEKQFEKQPDKPQNASVIHDIGYQRYEGLRLGRAHAVRALYVASLRSAFGLGRSAKAKMLPFGLMGLLAGIGALLAVVRQVTGEVPLKYMEFPIQVGLLIIIFLAVVAPELVSRDLGNKTLSLYFSRPISRVDYAVAKLAALMTALFSVLMAPLLIMFVGAALSVDGLGKVWDEFREFVPGMLTSLGFAVTLSSLALLIASSTGRRAFAAGGVVAVFLVTTPVAGVISEIGNGAIADLGLVLSPLTLLEGARAWTFRDGPSFYGDYGWVYALVTIVLAASGAALFIQRYRKVAA
jgi:ABC-2 type transport system permease protein